MPKWIAAITTLTCLAAPARAADMRVHIGGHTYDLPRTLDDGASDTPDPEGPKRETILLRANAPGVTPRTDEDAVNPAPLFAQNTVEILGQAVADAPGQSASAEKEHFCMRNTLVSLVKIGPPAPTLKLVPAALAPQHRPPARGCTMF